MTFNGSKSPYLRLRSLGLLAMAGAAGLLSGCLDRPVGRTKPETNNIFVTRNPSGGIDKIDILFMIDNSLSMGDKQAVLAAAVPQLLGRLTNPDCVVTDETTGTVTRTPMANPTESCAEGQQREFAPVKDIHIGVVSSSLGDYGGDVCPESAAEASGGFPDQNDHGWLLGALPRTQGLLTAPFLSWTKNDAADYDNGLLARTGEFANFVTAAGEIGCGLEMSLESWYRFLVDPEPPMEVGPAVDPATNKPGSGMVVRQGVDETIKELRKKFLRSDSLVAVVMLSDENDCSLKDRDSYSWVPAKVAADPKTAFRMWRGSAACTDPKKGPNDPCCYSCMAVGANGQPDLMTISNDCKAQDPTCNRSEGQIKDAAEDPTGLRCRDMKSRFGFDFLFPVTRYSNALTLKKLCPDQTYGDLDCECTAAKAKGIPCDKGSREFTNPLFDQLDPNEVPTGPDRESADAVFFTGIVGVPWQDLATDAAVKNPTEPLAYKVASELNWDLFAPTSGEPLDPLMIETPDEKARVGKIHPITGEAVAPPSAGFGANSINGHEWNTAGADLQFACIFSLEKQIQADKPSGVRVCDIATYCPDPSDEKCKRAFIGCSCTKAMPPTDPNALATWTYTDNSPLCQKADGTYGGTQVAAKAYPGVRQLQALRSFYDTTKAAVNGTGNNTIVASICPKDLTYANQKKPGYGYNPAVAALVDRLKEKLGGTCLPRPLKANTDGTVPCQVVEVIPNSGAGAEYCGNCRAMGREDVKPELSTALQNALKREGVCGGEGQSDCTKYCYCGLPQLKDGDDKGGTQCLTALNIEKNANSPGYCYIDPAQQEDETLRAAENKVVGSCPAAQKRQIRIVGSVTQPAPAPGFVYIACSGAPFSGSIGSE